uniref:Nucleoporin Nup120/160 beta-propeller domain-containing protein n=1 Tax=Timema tahoe TaxID=61484 RepID=A0A7R9FHG9_9NEOP|nr:unnamed protein product [Timema tahoe]
MGLMVTGMSRFEAGLCTMMGNYNRSFIIVVFQTPFQAKAGIQFPSLQVFQFPSLQVFSFPPFKYSLKETDITVEYSALGFHFSDQGWYYCHRAVIHRRGSLIPQSRTGWPHNKNNILFRDKTVCRNVFQTAITSNEASHTVCNIVARRLATKGEHEALKAHYKTSKCLKNLEATVTRIHLNITPEIDSFIGTTLLRYCNFYHTVHVLRISQDVLELVEHSLDLNLSGNTVRYKFQDTHILEGITIHETFNNVVILIATVSSVHRLLLPHPNRIHKEDHTFTLYPDLGTQSIFAGVTLDAAQNSSTFHVINHPVTNTCLPHTCVTWLAMKEEALFALAYNTGLILLIRLDPVSGVAVTQELKQDTLMPRFLSGIAGALRGKASDDLVAVSMVLHEIGLETYLFAVCQDGYLRMWSCSRAQLVAYTSLLSDGTEHGSTQGAQHHVIRKAICPKTSELLLGVFLCYESQSEFCIVKPVNESGTHHFQFIYTINADKFFVSRRKCKTSCRSLFQADLVDFCLSPTEVWAVWISAQMETVVSRACITKEDGEGDSWHPVILEQPMENKLEITDPCLNPWRAYTNYIFHPGQFPIIIITKALSLFCRSTTLSDVNLSLSVLKDQVCVAVETEIRKEAKECELSDDEYLDLAESCWAKFYACCVHYHRAASKPVGLVLLRQTGLVLVKKHHFSLIR